MAWPKGRRREPVSEPHDQRLHLMVTEQLLASLDHIAEQRSVTRAVVVREALEHMLAQQTATTGEVAEEPTPEPAAA